MPGSEGLKCVEGGANLPTWPITKEGAAVIHALSSAQGSGGGW